MEPTMPAQYQPNDINWELVQAADEILREAGTPIPLITGMRDSSKQQIKRIDPGTWDTVSTQATQLKDTYWDDPQEIAELVDSVVDAAELSPRERDLILSIIEGDLWGPHSGGYKRLATALHTTPAAVKMAWSRCRKKLVDNWASPQLESTRTRKTLRTAQEGDGHRV